MQKRRMRLFVVTVLVLLVAASCATPNGSQQSTFIRDSYRGLKISMETYDKTMQAMAELYGEGLVTADQMRHAINVAQIYYSAHLTAVSCLEAYKKNSGAVEEERLKLALEDASKIFGELLAYTTTILKMHGKEVN